MKIKLPKQIEYLIGLLCFVSIATPASKSDALYNKYKNKVIIIEGKMLRMSKVQRYLVSGHVLQILDDGSVLLRNTSPSGLNRKDGIRSVSPKLCRVQGISSDGLVDGEWSDCNQIAVNAGTFRYLSVAGATKTIQSYKIFQPLTRTEFDKYVASGADLPKVSSADYKATKLRKPKKRKKRKKRKIPFLVR